MEATEKQIEYIKILINEAIADINTPHWQYRWGKAIKLYQEAKYGGKLNFRTMSEEEYNAEYTRRKNAFAGNWDELRARMLNLVNAINVETLSKGEASATIDYLKNKNFLDKALAIQEDDHD